MRFLPVLILLVFPLTSAAASVRTPHVEAELVAARTAIEPGKPLVVALRLKMAPHWHTYWRNPGDSGLPTKIDWKLPAGYAAGDILWPVPQRLPAGPLMNFGYEGEVLLLAEVTVPQRIDDAAPVTLAARAEWLVCNPERCIPEGADFVLALPVGPAAPSRWAGAIERTRTALPAHAADHGPWRFTARGEAGRVVLDVIPPTGVRLQAPVFFPFEDGKIDNSAPQPVERAGEGYRLVIPASSQPVGEFTRVAGLLAAVQPIAANGMRAVEIEVPIEGVVGPGKARSVAAPAVQPAAALGLATALAFAFLGGLILNLMPCVLPVLSIKVLSFAAHGEQSARERRIQGALYAAGVVGSFLLLAAALVVLKNAGAALGWGFQLQSPVFVALLALLFFGIALNLSGVFEVGNLAPASFAGTRASRPRADALFSGVLAVLVASPCTAPFMGAALGYALVESAGMSFLVFAALGFGMALPYVLLAWNPRALKWLPRPGPWMVRFRQFLAFPLYGTVIWLAWVLGVQSGLDAVILLLAALLALAAAAWFAGGATGRRRTMRAAAVVFAVAAASLALQAAREPAGGPPQALAGAAVASAWEPYSRARLDVLAAAGKPVFVDFTAAWCVTCQVNKQLVLSRPDIERAFREKGVTLLRADWTRRDAEITQALAELGRNGVPVYVLHAPGRAARLLPEILTRETVLAALAEIAT